MAEDYYQQEDCVHVVVENPDGITFTQSVRNDFYSLLDFKASLGKNYWICEIY